MDQRVPRKTVVLVSLISCGNNGHQMTVLNGMDTVTETDFLVETLNPLTVGAGIVVITSFATSPVLDNVWLNSASTIARIVACQFGNAALVVGLLDANPAPAREAFVTAINEWANLPKSIAPRIRMSSSGSINTNSNAAVPSRQPRDLKAPLLILRAVCIAKVSCADPSDKEFTPESITRPFDFAIFIFRQIRLALFIPSVVTGQQICWPQTTYPVFSGT